MKSNEPRAIRPHLWDQDARSSRCESRFTLIYITVVGLTALALALTVVLALIGADSDLAHSASEACSTTYKMGFGAIVGLLSGRAD